MPEVTIDDGGRIVYEPDGWVLAQFFVDRAHVSMIRGPIGSGTSSCCCYKLASIAGEQAPGIDGIRRTRFAVIRNSYPELVNTTLKTWLMWFPEERYGRLNRSRPLTHTLKWSNVEMEVIFLALDMDEDVRKLRSLELTGAWFNEIEYAPKGIVDEAESRCGRYPPMMHGGPTWNGVIGDMNAPSEDCWIPQLRGEAPLPDEMSDEVKAQWKWPADWTYYVQPPGLIEVYGPDGKTVTSYLPNPQAENLKWLPPDYYLEKIQGKSKQWIDNRIMNRITFVVDGDPVWANYKPEVHRAQRPLPYIPGREVIVSLDFGLRPCALIGQEISDKLQLQQEFRMYGVSSVVFAPALKRFLSAKYPGATLRFTGDPKGADRSQTSDRSSYDIFRSYDMPIRPAPVPNNNLQIRLDAVSYALQTQRLLISPECTTLCAALAGKYHLRKLELGEAEPVKDKYSDAADCLQYMCLFIGEGRRMIGMDSIVSFKPRNVSNKAKDLRRVS